MVAPLKRVQWAREHLEKPVSVSQVFGPDEMIARYCSFVLLPRN